MPNGPVIYLAEFLPEASDLTQPWCRRNGISGCRVANQLCANDFLSIVGNANSG
jgi:hypothetical protein